MLARVIWSDWIDISLQTKFERTCVDSRSRKASFSRFSKTSLCASSELMVIVVVEDDDRVLLPTAFMTGTGCLCVLSFGKKGRCPKSQVPNRRRKPKRGE